MSDPLIIKDYKAKIENPIDFIYLLAMVVFTFLHHLTELTKMNTQHLLNLLEMFGVLLQIV